MSPETSILSPEEKADLDGTVLAFHPLEEQYENFEQQHEAASLGMWVFLATEVMFFGVLFLGVLLYREKYPLAFEKASEKLNWVIGGTNTIVLLVSSLTMVLAVHCAKLGHWRSVVVFLAITAFLGCVFLGLKGLEYYIDYRENLIPGWKFDPQEWVTRDGLHPEDVPNVQLFLIFYWVMTGLHGLHVTLGIIVVLVMMVLAWRRVFTTDYYAPIDVTGLYWHFVDTVWIFLLPTLYLLGTHTW